MTSKKELAIVAQEILSDFIPQPIITAIEGSKGVVKGTFKSGGRVFTFEIDPSSKNPIKYKPFVNAIRTDSDDVFSDRWDSLSVTYLDEFEEHLDAGKQFTTKTGKQKAYPKCGVKAATYGCGGACIGVKKTCRINANKSLDIKRLRALEKMAGGGDAQANELAKGIKTEYRKKRGAFNLARSKKPATDKPQMGQKEFESQFESAYKAQRKYEQLNKASVTTYAKDIRKNMANSGISEDQFDQYYENMRKANKFIVVKDRDGEDMVQWIY
jgi:hypothetical protein